VKIHVRLFASLRDVVGRETLEMELAPGATPATVWEATVSPVRR
jgi:hypothetical protein